MEWDGRVNLSNSKEEHLASLIRNKKWTNIYFADQEKMIKKLTKDATSLGIECENISLDPSQFAEFPPQNLVDLYNYCGFVNNYFSRLSISSDFISIHAPELLFLLINNRLFGNVFWHSYSSVPVLARPLLQPYVDQCAGAIFSLEDTHLENAKCPTYLVPQKSSTSNKFKAYMEIFAFSCGVYKDLPSTRIDDLSYNEMMLNLRPQHPSLCDVSFVSSSPLPLVPEQKYEEIVSSNSKMKQIFRVIDRIAKTNSSILVLGETGTGKELVARAIHKRSLRADKALVSVNCAAIPESLQEATLFGYEKGAFTGANEKKVGLIEKAHGGTLFLDELGCASMALQAKLLRVLETKKFSRVGSTKELAADFRIVCATNKDPEHQVQEGNFREDLRFRINSITLNLPPLRERKEDIILLADYFLETYQTQGQASIWDKKAKRCLTSYPWPGNIRELKHAIEFAAILDQDGVIGLDDLPQTVITGFQKRKVVTSSSGLHETRKISEREHIVKILEETKGNISQTAKKVGLTRPYLYEKIKALNIDINQYRK